MNAPPFGLLGRFIDTALELDPETRHALADLADSVIDLDVIGVGVLRLHLDGERVRVGPRVALVDAHVTIRGTPLSLARFAFVDDREKLVLSGEVSLHGDIALATRLQRIVARMDLDFEEALAQRMGDIPARQLSRRLRGFGGWMRAAGTALLADASEYLRYEAAATPVTEDVERFSNAVDAVRDDVERLEARVARLGRLGRQSGPRP